MEKKIKGNILAAGCLLAAFVLWTIGVCIIDVQAIGPQGSAVGFAELNGFVHNLIGVHLALYTITDWLGLVPVGFMVGFATLGAIQWIKRKHIKNVDLSILILGGFYIIMTAVYILFEYVVINRRPVLLNGYLEASYPSSTTLLTLCVMVTGIMQLKGRIRNKTLRSCICDILAGFTVFMVICRLLSGVHWFTDIVGGLLLSAGLVLIYRWFWLVTIEEKM